VLPWYENFIDGRDEGLQIKLLTSIETLCKDERVANREKGGLMKSAILKLMSMRALADFAFEQKGPIKLIVHSYFENNKKLQEKKTQLVLEDFKAEYFDYGCLFLRLCNLSNNNVMLFPKNPNEQEIDACYVYSNKYYKPNDLQSISHFNI
jgi:uncharacterized protein YutD